MRARFAAGAWRRWQLAWLGLGWLAACASETSAGESGWPRHLTVLVSAEQAIQARNAASALEQSLRTLPGVEAVYGSRANERLFFALRWPLYLTVDELQQVERLLHDERLGTSPGVLPEPLLPLILSHWPRANALYAASTAHAGTPDERELALLVRTRAGAEAEVAGALRGLAPELGPDVQLTVNDPGAHALWLGAAAPLRVEVASVGRARELQRNVEALATSDRSFALTEARSIETYLPGDARDQLALSQQVRAFLTSPPVASWSQERRDAARKLLPMPLTRVPGPDDLPGSVRELFRAPDGSVDRTLLLLPRPGLNPLRAQHRARVRQALERAGITEPAQGAFVSSGEGALTQLWSSHAGWLVLLVALLGFYGVRHVRARRPRRVLLVLCSALAVSLALTWAAAGLAGSWLRAHVPELKFAALAGWLPGRLEARRVQLALGTLELEAERVQLWPSGFGTVVLHADDVVLHGVVKVHGRGLHEDLALGDLSATASLLSPAEPGQIALRGGELELDLSRVPGARRGMIGRLRLTPRLFGRLPLLREAEPLYGFSATTSAAQAVHVTPGWRIERP